MAMRSVGDNHPSESYSLVKSTAEKIDKGGVFSRGSNKSRVTWNKSETNQHHYNFAAMKTEDVGIFHNKKNWVKVKIGDKEILGNINSIIKRYDLGLTKAEIRNKDAEELGKMLEMISTSPPRLSSDLKEEQRNLAVKKNNNDPKVGELAGQLFDKNLTSAVAKVIKEVEVKLKTSLTDDQKNKLKDHVANHLISNGSLFEVDLKDEKEGLDKLMDNVGLGIKAEKETIQEEQKKPLDGILGAEPKEKRLNDGQIKIVNKLLAAMNANPQLLDVNTRDENASLNKLMDSVEPGPMAERQKAFLVAMYNKREPFMPKRRKLLEKLPPNYHEAHINRASQIAKEKGFISERFVNLVLYDLLKRENKLPEDAVAPIMYELAKDLKYI